MRKQAYPLNVWLDATLAQGKAEGVLVPPEPFQLHNPRPWLVSVMVVLHGNIVQIDIVIVLG